MSDAVNISELARARFDLVVMEIRRVLGEHGRDPNVVLETRPEFLKIRLLVNPTNPGWLAWELPPSLLLSALETWQIAGHLLAEWNSVLHAGDTIPPGSVER